MSRRLFRVETRAANDVHYVVAADAGAAYQMVRSFLDQKGWFFEKDRSLKKVELIAEQAVRRTPAGMDRGDDLHLRHVELPHDVIPVDEAVPTIRSAGRTCIFNRELMPQASKDLNLFARGREGSVEYNLTRKRYELRDHPANSRRDTRKEIA